MRLYGYWRSSAAYRVRIALHWKGVEFEHGITDLRRGDDLIAVDNFFYVGDELFDALDSDGSGALDRGDEFVGVRTASFAGKRATSTVIDVGGLIAEAEGTSADYRPGTGLLTVFGATGLTADDIVGTF